MFCKKCGNKIEKNAKFCNKCGLEVKADLSKNSFMESVNSISANHDSIEAKGTGIIKCGNCGYIGPGESARSMMGKILAWICIIISWPITVIYFLATHKYRCPKCKSTFLGVKNKEGVFVGQRGGTGKWILIILVILVAVAVIAILSAIVLVNVTSYISKGKDASIKANMATIMVNAITYQDTGYIGFLNSDKFLLPASEIKKVNGGFDITENINQYSGHMCICSKLLASPDSTYCLDDTGYKKEADASCLIRCDYLGLCND